MEGVPTNSPRYHERNHHGMKRAESRRDSFNDALPAKLRVLVDFARHQEDLIKTLEDVSSG